MGKRFIIHDLEEEQVKEIFGNISDNTLIFAAKPTVKYCIGCFGCWTKSPGLCIINDRSQQTPAMLAASDEMIVISRNVYGGYSPDVKAVLDRNIGYLMPFFRIIKGEMHHTMRYDNPFIMRVHFYGIVDEATKGIAQDLVKANALNMGAGSNQVYFHKSYSGIKEAI